MHTFVSYWQTSFIGLFYHLHESRLFACVCVCVCQPESASIHCLRSPGDDVETKHFWPASLPRCGDWFSGVTAVFLSHKTVLSSTEQMALYGVASVYYRKRGQKVLTVEWFVSMQAQHTHICFTNLIFHVKWCPSYCLYAHNRLCRSLTKGHWRKIFDCILLTRSWDSRSRVCRAAALSRLHVLATWLAGGLSVFGNLLCISGSLRRLLYPPVELSWEWTPPPHCLQEMLFFLFSFSFVL